MCGIAGILMYPQERTENELEYIRKLADALLTENEVRGDHAAGIVTFKKDRSHAMLKQPVAASVLTDSEPWNNFVKENITNDTTNILLHTRYATQGEPDNNLNNHPIETYSCVGIHNGWINNDDQLFEEFGLHRAAEVDSEVIFRLVDHMGLRLTGDKMKAVAETISGAFTFAFVRKFFPHHMWVVKNQQPITFVYLERLNITLFASQRNFLPAAISYANIETDYVGFNPADLDYLEPDRETIWFFDTEVDTAMEQLTQQPIKFNERYDHDSFMRAVYGYDPFDEGTTAGYNASEHVTGYVNVLKGIESKLNTEEVFALHDLMEAEKAIAHGRGFEEGHASADKSFEVTFHLGYQRGYQRGWNDMHPNLSM